MYISYILWKSSSDWWSHGSRPWHPAVPPPNAGQSVEAVQNQFEAFKWGISISKSIYNIYITGGYPYLKVWPRICWMLVNMCVFNNTTWGLNGMWIMDRMGYWYYKTLCSISVCMFQNWEFKQQKSHLLKPTTMGICYGILMRYVTSTMIVGVWNGDTQTSVFIGQTSQNHLQNPSFSVDSILDFRRIAAGQYQLWNVPLVLDGQNMSKPCHHLLTPRIVGAENLGIFRVNELWTWNDLN